MMYVDDIRFFIIFSSLIFSSRLLLSLESSFRSYSFAQESITNICCEASILVMGSAYLGLKSRFIRLCDLLDVLH